MSTISENGNGNFRTKDEAKIDYDIFLKLLEKITESIPHPDSDIETLCKQFDECLHFEGGLEETLSQAMFPDVSHTIQKLNDLSDSLEQISLFPELNLKPVWLWAAKNTGFLFRHMTPLFRMEIPAALKNYNTIPFLLLNSDEFSLEILNFANSRIKISLSDYSILLSGKDTTKIALNQIIKMFILHIPLKERDGAYVFDAIYGDGRKRLDRFVTDRSCFLKTAAELQEHWTDYFDHKICDERNNSITDRKYIFSGDFFESFPLQKKIPIYGFFDEFLSVKNEVIIYYLNAIAEKRKHIRMLRDDSSMLDNNNILNDLRKKEEKEKELLEDEEKKISALFVQASVHIEKIRDDLNDVMTERRFVPNRISNLIFDAFFKSQGLSRKHTDLVIARMRVLDIPQLPMIEEFSSRTKQEETKIPKLAKNWIDAKILLALFHLPSPEKSPSPGTIAKLSVLLKYAEKHLSSGKEYYIQYLVQNDPDSLWKSLALGYQPAGRTLYSLYNQDRKKLAVLADSLIPEACYAIGKKDIEKYTGNINENSTDDFSFNSKAFFYMKVAASLHYIPALTYIAELFYKCFFANCELIKDEKRMNFATTTMAICEFLLQQSEDIDKENIQKIWGVTAFCAQKMGTAKKALARLHCPEAKFCRGYMYEIGKEYVQDLYRAKKLMQDAGDFPPAKKRIRSITSKINLKQARLAKEEHYDEDENYTREIHTTSCSSSSSCILPVILGVACTTGILRKMHTFEHREFMVSENRKNIVHEYYRTSSQIIAQLKNNPDARQEYETLRQKFLSDTFSAVQRRDYHTAAINMINMQMQLCKKYGIKISQDLLTTAQQEFPDLATLTTEKHV